MMWEWQQHMADGNGNPSAFSNGKRRRRSWEGKHGVESIISHPAALGATFWTSGQALPRQPPPETIVCWIARPTHNAPMQHTHNREGMKWPFSTGAWNCPPFQFQKKKKKKYEIQPKYTQDRRGKYSERKNIRPRKYHFQLYQPGSKTSFSSQRERQGRRCGVVLRRGVKDTNDGRRGQGRQGPA